MKKTLRLHRETVRHLNGMKMTMKGMRTPRQVEVNGGSSWICISVITEAPTGCTCTPLAWRILTDLTDRTPDPPPPPPDPNRLHATLDMPCYTRQMAACI